MDLLRLLQAIKEQPPEDYRAGLSFDETVIWQLGEFQDIRAVPDLERISKFKPDLDQGDWFVRHQKRTILLAKEALEKIRQSKKNIDRLKRAHCSLIGLSIGDALGGFFEFSYGNISPRITERKLPTGIWRWTDDTHMALSLFSVLRQQGYVDQDRLAASLARHYKRSRGYGMSTRSLLRRIQQGQDWRSQAKRVFRGQGSYGNGCASRVPPVGAFFAGDLTSTVKQAQHSAPVTHAHPEAIAGAVAVAAATAIAWQIRAAPSPGRPSFLDQIIALTPPSTVQDKLKQARDLAPHTSVRAAAQTLGNGYPVTVQMTVPFALWCAGEQLDNYEEAIWLTLEGQGDCDTTGAIVGGIVIMKTGLDDIPISWREACEALPEWTFKEIIE